MFGIVYLIDVLLGVDNQRIKNFRHDKISVYGIGKEFSKQEWQNIFRQLVSKNLLMVDMIGHGAIKITERGMQFLKEKETIELGKYTKRVKIKVKEKYKPATQDQTKLLKIETHKEKDLLALLKSKRLEIAKAQKVPPYVVFHDKTLVEMIKIKPKSIDEMSGITGIGEAKIRRYGQVFLDILLSHFN
jgi:ATP-dependent DNA helicase RecQ